MRYPFVVVAVCMSALVISGHASANETVKLSIHNYVTAVHENLGFTGVVLAARNGKVVLSEAFGLANTDQRKKLETSALFEIASCTKPFTAVAILVLAEEGKLSLDDSIAKHLPGVPDNCKNITIRHLVAHTSGIPGSNATGSPGDAEAAVKLFLSGGPKHAPGARYEYWNQGYSLLSEIIARTSDGEYTDFIRDRIFKPVGMTASGFTGDNPPEGLVVSVGLSERGRRSALDHPYGSYGFQYRGMGGLVTNLVDLWKFDRALKDGRILSQHSLDEMIEQGPGGYGLGWQIQIAPDGQLSHGHGGGVRGFTASIWRYPSVDGSLFVLANQDDPTCLSIVKAGAESLLFGKPFDFKLPSRPDDALVKRVLGRYLDSRKRLLSIEATAGLPKLKIFWGGPVTRGYLGLSQTGEPTLYMASHSMSGLRFTPDTELEFAPVESDRPLVSLTGLSPALTFSKVGPK